MFYGVWIVRYFREGCDKQRAIKILDRLLVAFLSNELMYQITIVISYDMVSELYRVSLVFSRLLSWTHTFIQ